MLLHIRHFGQLPYLCPLTRCARYISDPSVWLIVCHPRITRCDLFQQFFIPVHVMCSCERREKPGYEAIFKRLQQALGRAPLVPPYSSSIVYRRVHILCPPYIISPPPSSSRSSCMGINLYAHHKNICSFSGWLLIVSEDFTEENHSLLFALKLAEE